MPEPASITIGFCLASYTALQAYARGSSAFSREDKQARDVAAAIVESFERSASLFGGKAEALSQLSSLAIECADANWDGEGAEPVNPYAHINAEIFLRALPANVPMPEFAIEPDGCISLDWIQSSKRLFSLSVGANNRLAYAWLDGVDRGHAVAQFDGRKVPTRVLEGIAAITGHVSSSIQPA